MFQSGLVRVTASSVGTFDRGQFHGIQKPQPQATTYSGGQLNRLGVNVASKLCIFIFGTNLGLFKISFSTFWRLAPKCTETDLKKSQICPIWDQSESLKPKSNHKTESDSKYNLHRHLINTIHWDILHYYACLSNNILRSLLRRYKPRHWQRTNYNLHKTPGVRDLATISHSWESNGTFIWTFVGIC